MNENTLSITAEQANEIQRAYSLLSGEISRLKDCVHPDIVKNLVSAQKNIEKVFQEYWQVEENDDDQEYSHLEKISSDHKFMSTWSVPDVKSFQMNDVCDLKIKTLRYESWGPTQEINVTGKKTWLQVWALCDQMMRASEDTHHVFIEGFQEKSKGDFVFYTGS